MSQRTSKWFKTIEKVLCGLFFCKICCPYLDIRGAEHAAAIAILVKQASISADQSRRGKRQFFRARFYRSTKFRLSLILSLRESCWGVPSPNPAYAAYAA